jgi:hypothetical protein
LKSLLHLAKPLVKVLQPLQQSYLMGHQWQQQRLHRLQHLWLHQLHQL